ncbi:MULTISPECIES: hypothetical protein [unclassified Mesorhizobium]|uniref:hypothetical protein n=1 Tax=unclassified Mesorhizobium TaxID=325217 RepID=UPI0015E2DA26|nr:MULTISPECIES: hypothetical protein [unclassified Mesorhizobium]
MIEAVLTRLRAGDSMHMQFVAIADRLKTAGEIMEFGDSLFGLIGNSQSWGGERV